MRRHDPRCTDATRKRVKPGVAQVREPRPIPIGPSTAGITTDITPRPTGNRRDNRLPCPGDRQIGRTSRTGPGDCSSRETRKQDLVDHDPVPDEYVPTYRAGKG